MVRLVTSFRIEKRVEKQLSEFKRGLFEIIPQQLLSIFDERELEVRCASSSALTTGAHRRYRSYPAPDWRHLRD
jgi:E3 ubiquitin-protein ligase NEDD4